MVRKRIINFLSRQAGGIHEAAYLLAVFALLSQLLALVRDRLLAGAFGAGPVLDLYYASFRLPDFLFATLASLFSLYALLPTLSRLEEESEGLVISFLRQVLWFFFIGFGTISGLAIIFTPVLVGIIAPGLAGPPLILLIRIILLQPLLLGLSNILASFTQLRHRFLLYSISPLLYNLGIIVGVVFFYPHIGLAGLGWGVVMGAALHALIQVPFFTSERATVLSWRRGYKLFKEVLFLSVPRTLALAAGQITLLILVAIASLFATGSIAIFMLAYNLRAVPLAIIGVSYSVAAFPTLARLHSQGAYEEFSHHVEMALRHIIFWSVPATVLVIVLRAYLVRVILGAGAFSWAATKLTAAALALFIVSLLAESITLLVARGYYAAGKTARPLAFGLADVIISVVSASLLVFLLHSNLAFRSFLEIILRVSDVGGTTVLMLAVGLSLGSVAEGALSLIYFASDFKLAWPPLRQALVQSLSAALVGGAVTYIVLTILGPVADATTLLGVFFKGLTGGLLGIVAAGLVLSWFKNREFLEVFKAATQKLHPAPRVALEPTDVS